MEEWRVIPGYEGIYAASSRGGVMSMNFANSGLPGILRPKIDRGYARVCLYQKNGSPRTLAVHCLVALAFLGSRPSGMQINHKNGIKSDNRAENLEYCTNSENMKHAFAMGLQSNKGESHSQSKLTDAKVLEIKQRLLAGEKQLSIAIDMGVTQSAIAKVANGSRWGHVICIRKEA